MADSVLTLRLVLMPKDALLHCCIDGVDQTFDYHSPVELSLSKGLHTLYFQCYVGRGVKYHRPRFSWHPFTPHVPITSDIEEKPICDFPRFDVFSFRQSFTIWIQKSDSELTFVYHTGTMKDYLNDSSGFSYFVVYEKNVLISEQKAFLFADEKETKHFVRLHFFFIFLCLSPLLALSIVNLIFTIFDLKYLSPPYPPHQNPYFSLVCIASLLANICICIVVSGRRLLRFVEGPSENCGQILVLSPFGSKKKAKSKKTV